MNSDLPPEVEKHVSMFKGFLKCYYWDEIVALVSEYPDRTALRVNLLNLRIAMKYEEFRLMMKGPEIFIRALDFALRDMDLPIEINIDDAHVELFNFEEITQISQLSEKYASRFVSVQGTIKQLSDSKPTYKTVVFMCLRCGHLNTIEQPLSGQMVEPVFCENETCSKKGPFTLDNSGSIKTKSRVVILQEDINGLETCDRPKTLKIRIQGHELCNSVQRGQRVIMSGILNIEFDVVRGCQQVTGNWILDLNCVNYLESTYQDVTITDDDEQKIIALSRDPDLEQKLISSVAPSVRGMAAIKEAVCLQMFGGVSKKNSDGTALRGDTHILIIGDPGVAKSQILGYVVKAAPHSVYATGVGSSGVGITASVVADELNPGSLTYAPGALVLANGGIACLDELDKMDPENRNSLHEPMEQQTFSLTKAGLNETLPTRCSILAAANPKYGRFDQYEPIANQVNLPPSLLSRFDLILVAMDVPESSKDRGITDQICDNHVLGTLRMLKEHGHSVDTLALQKIVDRVDPPITIELLRKYIAYARRNVFPVFGPGVQEYLQDRFGELRNCGKKKGTTPIPVTYRSFEGMIRLAESSARSRISTEISLQDAKRVVRIMTNCLRSVGVDPETGELDTDVIQCGRSHSQREIIKVLMENIKSVGKRHPRGEAQLEDVFLSMDGAVPRDRFNKYINELKQRGDIYSPDAEHVKLTK